MAKSISRRKMLEVSSLTLGATAFGWPQNADAGWEDFLKQFAPKNVNVSINGNILIDGIRLPAFSAGWFAANIGIGVLQSLGAGLFTAFISALFGGESIEDRLRRLLTDFATIVEKELKENDLRNYTAQLASVKSIMAEYSNTRERFRLDSATIESSKIVELMKSLEIAGYLGFLSAAGMRLAILDERASFNPEEKKNIVLAKENYIANHIKIETAIAQKTDPERIKQEARKLAEQEQNPLSRDLFLNAVDKGEFNIKNNIAGVRIDGKVKDIDWVDVRRRARENTTAIGEKVLELWGARKVMGQYKMT